MCYCTPAMLDASNVAVGGSSFADNQNIEIQKVSLRMVRLPLNEAFETSFGSIDSRLIFLVCIEANGITGWGECVAAEEPRYSYECIGTAHYAIKNFLVPAVMRSPIQGLSDLAGRMSQFKGHNMAKAGLELAF